MIGIAKMSLMFIGGQVLDAFGLESISDLSDMNELGAALFQIEVKEFKEMVKEGESYLKENMPDYIEKGIAKTGYDPDELYSIWLENDLK